LPKVRKPAHTLARKANGKNICATDMVEMEENNNALLVAEKVSHEYQPAINKNISYSLFTTFKT
jgi:hypothetical protein